MRSLPTGTGNTAKEAGNRNCLLRANGMNTDPAVPSLTDQVAARRALLFRIGSIVW